MKLIDLIKSIDKLFPKPPKERDTLVSQKISYVLTTEEIEQRRYSLSQYYF
ncbi:MAG: hypothetical protein ABIJ14_01320 [Nanoarchaeota archaeon]